MLLGTLADLPALAQKGGGGPAVLVFGEVLRTALDRRAPALADAVEDLLKRA